MKTKFNYEEEEEYQDLSKVIIEINGSEYHLSEEFGELNVIKIGNNAKNDGLRVLPKYSNSVGLK